MKYETTHLIYFSPTHTSAAVAQAVARGLGMPCTEETDLTYTERTQSIQIRNAVAVIAVPVYGGRVAPAAVKRLARITGDNTPAVLIAVYGNRDYEDALVELQDIVTRQGFITIAAGAFIGEHSYSRPAMPIAQGRPDREDIAEAEKFGRQAAEKLSGISDTASIPALPVKGNRPYKEVKAPTPAAPLTLQENCTACGLCIDLCPTDSIRFDDQGEIATAPDTCIKCCACVKECPNEARVFDTPYTAMLHANFSSRREPETFL